MRPVIVVGENEDSYDVLLCGHDELRKQKNGDMQKISDFYTAHPEYKIKPYVLRDYTEEGFKKPSYVNIYDIKRLPKGDVGANVGKLTNADIDGIESKLNTNDNISETLLNFLI